MALLSVKTLRAFAKDHFLRFQLPVEKYEEMKRAGLNNNQIRNRAQRAERAWVKKFTRPDRTTEDLTLDKLTRGDSVGVWKQSVPRAVWMKMTSEERLAFKEKDTEDVKKRDAFIRQCVAQYSITHISSASQSSAL